MKLWFGIEAFFTVMRDLSATTRQISVLSASIPITALEVVTSENEISYLLTVCNVPDLKEKEKRSEKDIYQSLFFWFMKSVVF